MRYGSATAAAAATDLLPTEFSQWKRIISSVESSTRFKSRLPLPIRIDTTTNDEGEESGHVNSSPKNGLRRRKASPTEPLPLREMYLSQEKSAINSCSRPQSSSDINLASLKKGQSSAKSNGTNESKSDCSYDRDVEKGNPGLDGWPLRESRRNEINANTTRLTFDEWSENWHHKGGRARNLPASDDPCRFILRSGSSLRAEQGSASSMNSVVSAKPGEPQASSEKSWAEPSWRDIPQGPLQPPSVAPTEDSRPYSELSMPDDPSRKLTRTSLYIHRTVAALIVFVINTLPLVAYFESHRHLWVLIFILFVKAKDFLSTVVSLVMSIYRTVACSREPKSVPPQTILSLVTISFEREEQIMKTLDSIREAQLEPHRQILCFILDGEAKPDIERRIVRARRTIKRPYMTWQFKRNELTIDCGFLEGLPIIFMQKANNEGKKDSLILCHDLFNWQRSDVPQHTKVLRDEIWNTMFPALIANPSLDRIDAIFCTDADSTIHPTCQKLLVEALHAEEDAIAACGILFTELDYRTEWTIWSLFQQFQVIRRRAEGIWGRVTCLPGCVTMIKVRPEMAPAISVYAKPVRDRTFWRHQVQYLGTDRRLTYSMISQSKGLKTLVVPDAVSETVCPQNLAHYLNQRRRWGSNAYFNNFFYCFGRRQFLVTRLWAFIDISRMTLVYYRQANNILFLWHLLRHFAVIKIVPLLVVTQTPTLWFLLLVIFRHPILRRRLHKLLLGMLLNYLLSPILSIAVFTRMIVQLGSIGITWDEAGTCTAEPDPTLRITTPRGSLISMYRLAALVRSAFSLGSSSSHRSHRSGGDGGSSSGSRGDGGSSRDDGGSSRGGGDNGSSRGDGGSSRGDGSISTGGLDCVVMLSGGALAASLDDIETAAHDPLPPARPVASQGEKQSHHHERHQHRLQHHQQQQYQQHHRYLCLPRQSLPPLATTAPPSASSRASPPSSSISGSHGSSSNDSVNDRPTLSSTRSHDRPTLSSTRSPTRSSELPPGLAVGVTTTISASVHASSLCASSSLHSSRSSRKRLPSSSGASALTRSSSLGAKVAADEAPPLPRSPHLRHVGGGDAHGR